MPDYLGNDQRKTKEEEKDDGPIRGKSKYAIQIRVNNAQEKHRH